MKKEIDLLINGAIADGAFPGANLGIVINDKAKVKSYGNKALFPSKEENNLNTLYDMASCSKVIATTTSIMILLEQGKLRLYDNVDVYLTEFQNKEINIWDLLTHSSGLPADVARSHFLSKSELYEKIMTAETIYPKNTKIVYSDIGFILLGMVIEKISGMTLDKFTKKYIFEPLEMFNTGYCPQDINQCAPTEDRGDKIDRGYVHDEKAKTMGGVAGHAGLFSTIEDVCHFLQMILNDGIYNGKRVLSKQSVNLLFIPQVEVKNGVILDNERRALGWIVKGSYPCSGDLASINTIMHTGFTGTHVVIDKDNKVAYCLLSNRVHPTRANNKIIAFRAKLGNYIISHLENL